MYRSWGVVTYTGAAQPLFYDTATAAIAIPGAGNPVIVTVASTAKYQVGDRIVAEPGAANSDTLLVFEIKSGTVMYCVSEGNVPTHAHAINSVLQLSIACREWGVQHLGAALAVLGTDNTVTAVPGGSAFHVLQPATAPAQENEYRSSPSSVVNGDRTNDAWIIGTSTQQALVYAKVL